jgi:hypothetical protein
VNINLSQPAIIALCLIGVIFVIFNVALFAIASQRMVKGKNPPVQRIKRSMRNPWQDEDDSLNELSSRISQLQQSEEPTSKPDLDK